MAEKPTPRSEIFMQATAPLVGKRVTAMTADRLGMMNDNVISTGVVVTVEGGISLCIDAVQDRDNQPALRIHYDIQLRGE